MKTNFIYILIGIIFPSTAFTQNLVWENVDAFYAPLPPSVHVYKTESLLDGNPNIAYYVVADLKDKKLNYTTDTSSNRRLTPFHFYKKNNQPTVVVNTTFFSFATHQNLNVVIKNGKLKSYNIHSLPGRGKDTLTFRHPFTSAIGITKKGKADVAWVLTDSSQKFAFASQVPLHSFKDSIADPQISQLLYRTSIVPVPHSGSLKPLFKKWKVETAVGGGPVLLQNGEIKITNNEELKFSGKAINDKHPRTAMGYTADNKLIILVVEGRNPGNAEGASLVQLANMLKEIGCVEALNLDGGGSSCLLINGKETIKPSDKGVQRAVPAVFIIEKE